MPYASDLASDQCGSATSERIGLTFNRMPKSVSLPFWPRTPPFLFLLRCLPRLLLLSTTAPSTASARHRKQITSSPALKTTLVSFKSSPRPLLSPSNHQRKTQASKLHRIPPPHPPFLHSLLSFSVLFSHLRQTSIIVIATNATSMPYFSPLNTSWKFY